jgi:cytochrome c5
MMRVLAALFGVVMASQMVATQSLPPGPGAEVLASRCVVCHESDIITSQKLSLTGWTNSVAKMIRWGSQITPQERDVLQPYLAMHFGPVPAVSHQPAAAADAGAATYQRACLVCHQADIISQQKLSRAGWTNSVNKMIRWGAAVPEAEKDALIDYLAAQYPPR